MTGIVLICSSIIINIHANTKLSFAAVPHDFEIQNSETRSIPTFISIPSISVNLPVTQTGIANGIWEIDDQGVSHLGNSAYPGEKKGIIMYAHNTADRFGKLHEISIGDSINVVTRNGKLYTYSVSEISVVSPNELEALEVDDETLILYTCTGFADLKRLVVKATKAV